MSILRLSSVLAGFFFSLHGEVGATTSDWQTIVAGKSETIGINKASIERTTSGTTAWSRIMLDHPVNDVGGVYDAMHAQNLYNCAARHFTTLRRAYFRGDTLVREDVVARQRPNAIEVGSLDERIFNVACTAIVSSSAHAGVASAGTSFAANLTLVADREAVATDEKPKLIILPPIDKAAADKAAAEQAAASAEKKPLAALPAPPSPAPKISSSSARQGVESPADKRLRELHYATSGPRKAVKKRPTATLAVNDQGALSAPGHGTWSYDNEDRWAKLREDYALCAMGKRQSPINIHEGIKVHLEEIAFDYKPMQFRIIDTGHTVQVTVGEGLSLKVSGKRYELLQFHFHRPSEERINGRAYDMVMHLVHRNDEGQLAVIAVLLEKGSEHPLIQTLWNNLPLDQNIEMAPAEAIDLNKLLPENRTYWAYMGSLTTPPCTEGVLWMVLKQPMQVSAEQVSIFSRLYRNNARPLQPSNGRLIKESR